MFYKFILFVYLLCIQIAHIESTYNGNNVKVKKAMSSSNYIGGVIAIDGHQTSCEVVPIGNIGLFIAASCVANTKGSTLSVFMRNSNNTLSKSDQIGFEFKDITFHSKYSAAAMANNIAIIKLAEPENKLLEAMLAQQNNMGDKLVYSRNALLDNMEEWGSSHVISNVEASSAECDQYYMISQQNPGRFTCTSAKDTDHNIPYAISSIEYSGITYPFALLSHSFVEGQNITTSNRVHSYYTVLHYYKQFARDTLGNDLLFSNQGGFDSTWQNNNNNDMIIGPMLDNPTRTLVSGDLFANRFQNYQDMPSSSTLDTETKTESPTITAISTIDDVNSFTDDVDENNDSPSQKGTKKTTIIIACVVCLIVVPLLIGALVYFYIRMRRRKQAIKYWDREMEHMQTVKSIVNKEPYVPLKSPKPTKYFRRNNGQVTIN